MVRVQLEGLSAKAPAGFGLAGEDGHVRRKIVLSVG